MTSVLFVVIEMPLIVRERLVADGRVNVATEGAALSIVMVVLLTAEICPASSFAQA